MVPSITGCEAALLDRSLQVAQAELGWQIDIAARRRDVRPNQVAAVPVKLLSMVGAALARVGGRRADAPRPASLQRAIPAEVQHTTGQPANLVLFAGARVIDAPLASDRYPTLAVIDRARADGRLGFAEDPDAARLERLARAMTEQVWSEMAWITGFVPERAFNLVCEALERERMSAAISEHAGEPAFPAAA